MKQHSVFAQPQPDANRITQWIVGKNDFGLVDYRKLLLPTLAWQTHHNDQRWVTWIASQFIERKMLEEYEVNLSTLRMVVDSTTDYSSYKLLLTALKNNRSSMVIASLPGIDNAQLYELEGAAAQGNCHAVILIH